MKPALSRNSNTPKTSLSAIRADIKRAANPETAKALARYFKTGPDEYGAGDVFLGIKVPVSRKIALAHRNLPLKDVERLLLSNAHEERLIALLLLVRRYEKGDTETRERVFKTYLKHLDRVNNWDLVDGSAPPIVGRHLFEKRDTRLLYKLARSASLWRRRVAMLATYYFIRENDYADALKLAELLLNDEHDLMHKAVGWMLREIGNRDPDTEKRFLATHAARMPRTALRYAIEKLPEKERKSYLAVKRVASS